MTKYDALRTIALATITLMSVPQYAHAYLDPGTGSYVFQIVIASVLGAAFAIKTFWFRIKHFLGNLLSRKSKGN